MHPNNEFRTEDRALMEALIDDVGFGMIFLTTPDGPRVAHTPLISTGRGAVQFHLARGNALTRHLDGARALVTVNGPDGYISPRWYADRDTVPTWNYVALELEGTVRQQSAPWLDDFLHRLIARHEGRVPGEPWRSEEASAETWAGLIRGIVGFELEIAAWRPTLKLSQNKSGADRAAIGEGLERSGAPGLAALMRTLAA